MSPEYVAERVCVPPVSSIGWSSPLPSLFTGKGLVQPGTKGLHVSGLPLSVTVTVPVASKAHPVVVPARTGWQLLAVPVLFRMSILKM